MLKLWQTLDQSAQAAIVFFELEITSLLIKLATKGLVHVLAIGGLSSNAALDGALCAKQGLENALHDALTQLEFPLPLGVRDEVRQGLRDFVGERRNVDTALLRLGEKLLGKPDVAVLERFLDLVGEIIPIDGSLACGRQRLG